MSGAARDLVGPTSSVDTSAFGDRRHLLTVSDLGRSEIEQLLDLTDTFVEVSNRAIPKVPALRGRTVVTLFFEDSTRTRLSF
ncbi:MAG: aspartate carbamoyltransferase catalytic subunit, partial [Actinomycetes bacterium]